MGSVQNDPLLSAMETMNLKLFTNFSGNVRTTRGQSTEVRKGMCSYDCHL